MERYNMAKNSYLIHAQYLAEFVKPVHLEPALNQIGKSICKLEGILSEPEYLVSDGKQHITMCDYLFLFNGNECVPGELKGSYSQKRKATSQLRSGKMFAEELLHRRVEQGMMIVYSIGNYEIHKISL